MQSNLKDNRFFQQTAKIIAFFVLLYAIGFSFWTVFYTETGNGDNVEHIHATWLVAYGKVPYRDFFEHHNPLLWYVFAPILKHFMNPVSLLDLAHAIGILGGIATFFVVYKICTRFFASKFATLLSLLTLCPPYYYIFCFNYNPDTFMALCFALGLYFLFSFWDKPKLVSLCLSFEMFFLAFLFTQKILIVLFVLGVLSLYIFYQKRTPAGIILNALVLPVLSLFLFIALLYHADALEIYWKSNYPFNVIMQKYYGNNKISVTDYKMLVFSVMTAIVSIICFFRTSGLLFKLISLLFIVELLLRCFYFSIAPYYLLPLMIYVCCLNSVLVAGLLNKNLLFAYLLLAVSCYYAYISYPKYIAVRGKDRSFARYLAQNITPCDYILNSYLGNQSINAKDPHYYWSMLGHVDIAGEETGIAAKPDVSELVLKYKPKFAFGGVYWSSYHQNRGQHIFIQQVAGDLIWQYYLPTPFPDIYILRKEYWGKNCQYNPQIKEWQYAN
ncbi:MAG: glycosyltransferase family 39 protein [Alphaproteobacteria bacterium]|nr:glycosyltransferase family 39 protein [Alphaproteobacteria bacterium]